MKILRESIFGFGLGLILVVAGAGSLLADVVDPYRSEVIVTGTGEPERSRGFRAGFVDTLIKVTGDVRQADNPALSPFLDEVAGAVETFEYEDRMKGIPVHDEQGTRERPHFLRIAFNPQKIDAVIADLGLEKWSEDRPVIALWLGIETVVKRYVLTRSGDDGYGQRAVVAETSKRRVIPVELPMENEGDGPEFEDISAGDLAVLSAASGEAPVLLAGVLRLTDSGYWRMDWTLLSAGQQVGWSYRDVTFDTAIKGGLEGAALYLSGALSFEDAMPGAH